MGGEFLDLGMPGGLSSVGGEEEESRHRGHDFETVSLATARLILPSTQPGALGYSLDESCVTAGVMRDA